MTPHRTLTLAEWRAEGLARFGPKELLWRFQCPACGHIQKPEDFRPIKERGVSVTAETARFNCIGRYTDNPKRAFGDSPSGPGPCDYTSGGLFDIRPVTVVTEHDGSIRSFEFDLTPTTK